MNPTAAQKHQIIAAVHPQRLQAVMTNIHYLRLMTAMWLGGTHWSLKECPAFDDVCALVLFGDDIPKDLHGYDEAKLRALVTLYEDQESYEAEVERAAVAWLWDTLKLSGSIESTPLPDGLLDAV